MADKTKKLPSLPTPKPVLKPEPVNQTPKPPPNVRTSGMKTKAVRRRT
jgi:hypothetical protein